MDDEFRRMLEEARAESGGAAKTLPDMIEAFTNDLPKLDDRIEDLVRRYPRVVADEPDGRGGTRRAYRLSFLAAVAIFEFLLRSYGVERKLPPYQPPGRRN